MNRDQYTQKQAWLSSSHIKTTSRVTPFCATTDAGSQEGNRAMRENEQVNLAKIDNSSTAWSFHIHA